MIAPKRAVMIHNLARAINDSADISPEDLVHPSLASHPQPGQKNADQVPVSRSAGPRIRADHLLHLSDDLPADRRTRGFGSPRRLALRRLPTESGLSADKAKPGSPEPLRVI